MPSHLLFFFGLPFRSEDLLKLGGGEDIMKYDRGEGKKQVSSWRGFGSVGNSTVNSMDHRAKDGPSNKLWNRVRDGHFTRRLALMGLRTVFLVCGSSSRSCFYDRELPSCRVSFIIQINRPSPRRMACPFGHGIILEARVDVEQKERTS
ncbi:hypothetical protein HAX54_024446 [Datura stramonium]|uniref:Uncharacterized protein n=1 Tax=Datura stramonium TaxID=4076 RepID=A0ABS8S6H4_DATST|nr:hypothetical protein [Datura stramonium]